MNLFINKENKLYSQTSGSDTLFWIDCSQPTETIIRSNISAARDTILKKKCNVLSVNTNDLKGNFYRNADYYFNSEPKINPAWFKDVKCNSYDKIYPQLNALPLKIVVDRGAYKITMVATSIKEQKLGNAFFQLQNEAITAPTRK